MLLSIVIGSLVLSTAAPAAAVASAPDAAQVRPVPTGRAALTKNPIYRTGKFGFTECKELSIHPGSADVQLYAREPRLYLDHLLGCLNEAWAAEFKQAGLKFARPKVQYIGKPQRTICGPFPPAYVAGVYCPHKRALVVLANKNTLPDPTSIGLLYVIAHEYGHHVQELTGVFDVTNRLSRRLGKARLLELVRRSELQADCYSGAFIGAIWHSLDRDDFEVEDLEDKFFGSTASHGKSKSRSHWLRRGWNAESPGACNTWAAPRSRVA